MPITLPIQCPHQYASGSVVVYYPGHSVDITQDVVDINIRLSEDEPTQWSVVIDNSSGTYKVTQTPWLGQYMSRSTWVIGLIANGDYIDGQHYTHSVSNNHTWTDLHATAASANLGATDSTITVGGIDASYKLLVYNQSKDTIRSVKGNIQTSNGIISDILREYGFSSNLDGGLDYNVKWLHFYNEIPLDVIKKLLLPKFGHWRVDGNVFKTYRYNPGGSPTSYDLRDIECIYNLSYRKSYDDVATSVIVKRADEANCILFEEEGNNTQSHVLIADPQKFPDGGIGLHVIKSEVNGQIKELYFSPDPQGSGGWVKYPPEPFPCTRSMTFFFQPTLGAETWWYHIIVKARRPIENNEDPYDPSNYEVKYRNTTLEQLLGSPPREQPARDQIVNDLIPDKSTLEEFAQRFLLESAMSSETITLTTGLFPAIKPSDQITVYADTIGLENSNFYVKDVTHSLAQGTTTITAQIFNNYSMSKVEPWPPE